MSHRVSAHEHHSLSNVLQKSARMFVCGESVDLLPSYEMYIVPKESNSVIDEKNHIRLLFFSVTPL